MREVIKEGRDINEAIDLACRELGVERDDTSFEIIALPKRSFFGLKNTLAKVRVYLLEDEPVEAPKIEKTPPQKPPQRQPEGKPQQAPKPVGPKSTLRPVEARPQPMQKNEPVPSQRPIAPQVLAGTSEKTEPPKREYEPLKPVSDLLFVPLEQVDGKAKTAAEYLQSMLVEIGVNATITVAQTEGGIVLRLSGEGLGVIIGRRGETLDSLQYLVSLVANRAEGDYLRVTIDSGNYREKRERTLQQLARKLSSSVVRYGRPSTLEPMNPYERRIIHATVSTIEGVTSASIGEEPNRRVVINPTNPRPQSAAGRPPRPAGNRPFTPGGRPPRNDGKFGDRPPRSDGKFGDRPPRSDGKFGDRPPRSDGKFGDRPPNRENGTFAGHSPHPQGENVRPTSTELDREYAQQLEREPTITRPETSAQKPAPTREKTPDEGKDLPLYGKIDL